MENENKGQTASQGAKNNFVRNTIFFLIAILAIVIIFWVVSVAPKGKQVGIPQFETELSSGKISEVEINNSRIQFKYKDGSYGWFYNRGAYSENNVYELIKEYNDDSLHTNKVNLIFDTTRTINIMNILYPILLIASIIFFIWFISKQFKGVNKSGMEFTKNRARVAASDVTFDKVAGADEEKQELQEIVQFLKEPERFIKIGARIPKGVLLVGHPGTGKTLLAKAVAGEANVPFFTISGSDFMELYVGVGASRVRDLFETAKKAKPCIVFIDEIDAVGRQRGTGLGGGNDEREQTLNQLLVQMDGFDKNEGIIVMAATNRADILDPALTRPGRFDRQIYINIPDVKGREEILKVHAEGKPFDDDVRFKEIARVTSGFTGADLENVINEAAILAARNKREKITMEDLNNSIVKVTMGPQKRSRVVSERDKKITAYHESGHAIVEKCVKNGDTVHEVSIIQRGGAAGYTISRPEGDDNFMTRSKLKDNVAVMLGGRSAEELFLEDITTGASNDIMQATNIARKMVTEFGMSEAVGTVCHEGKGGEVFLGRDYQNRTTYSEKEASIIDAEVKKIIDEGHNAAKKYLQDNKKQMQVMVDVLLERETIYGEEVDMIMAGATKEEVIKFIDKKFQDKKAKKEKEIKEQIINKEDVKIEEIDSYVDSLLKIAEQREKDKAMKEENVSSEKPKTVKKTTSSTKSKTNSAKKSTTSKTTKKTTKTTNDKKDNN